MTFSEETDPAHLLVLTRRALAEAVKPKVSYEVDVAALSGEDADLGDTVAVIDTPRDPEWRPTARVVRRVRDFVWEVAGVLGCLVLIVMFLPLVPVFRVFEDIGKAMKDE